MPCTWHTLRVRENRGLSRAAGSSRLQHGKSRSMDLPPVASSAAVPSSAAWLAVQRPSSSLRSSARGELDVSSCTFWEQGRSVATVQSAAARPAVSCHAVHAQPASTACAAGSLAHLLITAGCFEGLATSSAIAGAGSRAYLLAQRFLARATTQCGLLPCTQRRHSPRRSAWLCGRFHAHFHSGGESSKSRAAWQAGRQAVPPALVGCGCRCPTAPWRMPLAGPTLSEILLQREPRSSTTARSRKILGSQRRSCMRTCWRNCRSRCGAEGIQAATASRTCQEVAQEKTAVLHIAPAPTVNVPVAAWGLQRIWQSQHATRAAADPPGPAAGGPCFRAPSLLATCTARAHLCLVASIPRC